MDIKHQQEALFEYHMISCGNAVSSLTNNRIYGIDSMWEYMIRLVLLNITLLHSIDRSWAQQKTNHHFDLMI